MPLMKMMKNKSSGSFERSHKNEEPMGLEKTDREISEEGLFDIAFNNYKQAHPESKIKRPEFRRNIWGTDTIAEYMSEDQYAKYQSYERVRINTGTMPSAVEGVHDGLVPAGVEERSSRDKMDEDPLADLNAIGGMGIPDEIMDGSEDEHMSELEPAYDELFMSDGQDENNLFIDEELVPERPRMGDGNQGGRTDTLVPSSEPFEEVEEHEGAYMDTVVQNSEDAGLGAYGMDGGAPGIEQESTIHMENGTVYPKESGNEKSIVKVSDKQPRGILAQEGIMEKLRRSMYLDDADTSLDDEIMQLSDREIFEQLIRLEGCVRKVGTISDIAESVFGASGTEAGDNLPSKERMVEIIANAAYAISYMMHFECSSKDEWNRTIAVHLGLSDKEQGMGFVPLQEINKEYVIRCYGMGEEETIVVVRGDYTRICQAVFLFEQSYTRLKAKSVALFLGAVGLDCWECEDEDVVADIEIVKGKVFLV